MAKASGDKGEKITLSKKGNLPSPERKKKKSLGRRLAKILGAFVLFLFILALVLFLFLRSDKGLDLARSELTKVLRNRGLHLTLDSLEGPLPGKIRAKGIVLGDEKGVFLTAKELLAEISLSSLLALKVNVENLSAEGVDFKRPPDLPKKEDDENDEDRSQTSLPNIDLAANVRIRDSLILSDEGGPLALSLANLDARLGFDKDTKLLALDARGSWLGPDGKGLTFKILHDRDLAPDKPLSLDLKATSGPSSPLAFFAENLPWLSPEITATGSGPLEN
ncbi:MAG: hypothetical protein LBF41_05240, partial [Deltaproteobacteria bacterium]|nr:hypothetical protein [Deltaproteobacteria bacterium]